MTEEKKIGETNLILLILILIISIITLFFTRSLSKMNMSVGKIRSWFKTEKEKLKKS